MLSKENRAFLVGVPQAERKSTYRVPGAPDTKMKAFIFGTPTPKYPQWL